MIDITATNGTEMAFGKYKFLKRLGRFAICAGCSS